MRREHRGFLGAPGPSGEGRPLTIGPAPDGEEGGRSVPWEVKGVRNVAQDLKTKERSSQDFAGVCGIYWEGNAWYDVLEATCATQDQLDLGKICPIYACARERGVAHCGVCPDFPCPLLVNFAAEGGPHDMRIESAAKRAELGDERWAEWAAPEDLGHRLLPPQEHPPAGGSARVMAASGGLPAELAARLAGHPRRVPRGIPDEIDVH